MHTTLTLHCRKPIVRTMSESAGRSPSVSSVSSISLLEVKAETHLVLKAFLDRSLSTSHKEQPGRVGGAYRDFNKYSCIPQLKTKDGRDSPSDVSSSDEKKSGFKGFMKQLPRRNTSRASAKDPKNSLDRSGSMKPTLVRQQADDDVISPSSSSEDEDGEKKQKRMSRKKLKKRLTKFFKLKFEKDKDGHGPKRPSTLPISKEPEPETAISPSKILHSHHPLGLWIVFMCDKEAVVQQLVQVLSVEGDSINTKIESDPFLRSNLARMSYASFAKLLDTFTSTQVSQAPPLPPSASPTLQRMAVTMEVSRRIVTATGTVRMKGYAECYMETFAPG
ncbi:hypothetical protein INR49_028188 [Caranx melampygus]|nr:hypothetical protein INR49_028188 [Caranx melampygus]